ncbi:hypothetical protein SHI21_16445 [Bacteriovorax sp. PP10]|uniref:Uncharacterized protein n=1 Tax=Bacteriovorax antarcticus TaxID=3088717 RepID=A0ABU5VXZ0_9BACT|nr:hypothetical protein [Bacteriovorax sp. PP10]MEA9357822.1 hypothetical protein [Bacteriovorax sp. PP10]
MNRNLLLIAMLLLFSACESQLGTTITGAFSNIVSGKFTSSSSGDEAYSEMKSKMHSKESFESVTPTCVPVRSIDPILSTNTKNMSQIKDKLCSCSPWGTCDAKSCSCEKLCPNDFSIFKPVKELDAPEDTLSFTNYNNKFSSGLTYKGYCWGISLLTQRFNRMASFSPKKSKQFTTAGQDSNRIRFYKGIINRINNNEVVDIPGFANLKEFSEDPEVKDLLEDSVKDLWSENAMSSQGLAMVASAKTPEKDELNKMYDDIEFRLKNNLSPSIVYNLSDDRTDAHVLLVSASGVRAETGERYLCLRDNTFVASMSQNCNLKMIIKKDGTLVREMGDNKLIDPKTKLPVIPLKVGKVALAHSENTNTMEQISNLRDKCRNDKNCNASGNDVNKIIKGRH